MKPKGGEKNSESRLKKSVFSRKTVGDFFQLLDYWIFSHFLNFLMIKKKNEELKMLNL